MYERFTERARRVMQLANQTAQRFNSEYIGTEHVLIGLVSERSGVAASVLKNLEIDVRKVRLECEKRIRPGPEMVTVGKLPQTPGAKKVIEYAMEEARNLDHPHVGTEHVLLGLIRDENSIAGQVLTRLGVTLQTARAEVVNLSPSREEASQPVQPSLQATRSKTPAIDTFTTDLTHLARKCQLRPVIGRETEIQRLIAVLARLDRNNPVLVGQPGVGRTAIVYGLAQQLVEGTIADSRLPAEECRIVELHAGRIVAGTKYRGQLEERVQAIGVEMRRAGNMILFVPDLHRVVQSVDAGSDPFEIWNTVLAQDEVRWIGTTTPANYVQLAAAHVELVNAFQRIIVDPPTSAETLQIVRGLRQVYEAYHRVKITDAAIEAVVEFSQIYMPDRALPETALNLIDQACAQLRVLSVPKPPDELKDIDKQYQQLCIDRDNAIAYQEFETAANLRDQAEKLKNTRHRLLQEFHDGQDADQPVSEEEVIAAFSTLTGIGRDQIRAREPVVISPQAEPVVHNSPRFEKLQCESILHGNEIEITPGVGCVLTPHHQETIGIFEEAILPAMRENGIRANLALDIYQPDASLSQVWQQIRAAEVVVADVSGCDPAVIYELGLCFGRGRFPIIVLQDPGDLPCSLRALRYLAYDNTAAGAKALREKLCVAIREFLAAARSVSGDTVPKSTSAPTSGKTTVKTLPERR